jgi:hypothetical protein
MRHGDGNAAFRLLQRQWALRGIAKHGWSRRLQLANAERLRKRGQQVEAAVVVTEGLQRQGAQSTVELSGGDHEGLRGRYGQAGVSTGYRESQCQPVVPGGECPACGWRRGSLEPHPIAIR